MKPTFKKVKHTGRFRAFELEQHLIKVGGREVGYIIQERQGPGMFLVRLAVKCASDPAGFKWIQLQARYSTAEAAREELVKYWDIICKKYNLHQFEKE